MEGKKEEREGGRERGRRQVRGRDRLGGRSAARSLQSTAG
jgi:hypothetical protein